jgi:hypothetical protein
VPRVAALYAALAGLFVILGLQQASQPYVIDEAVFPYVSAAVAETGRPVFYNGLLRPADIGIWHPPGYVYTLASWIVAFGDSHLAVRSFGLATALITAGLVAWIVRLVRPQAPSVLVALAFGLYLFHPLVLQSALVPDIDGTVGVLALAGALAGAVRIAVAERREPWHVPLLATLLFLALWTKLTTPLALIPVFVLALRPGAEGTRGWARDSILAIAAAIGAFVATWWILAEVTGMSFRYPFEFTLASFQKGGVGGLSIGGLVSRLLPSSVVWFWTGPLFILLAVIGSLVAFARWRLPGDRGLRLVALFGAAVFVIYDVIAGSPFGFAKYWIAAVPPMAVLAGTVLIDAQEALTSAKWRHGEHARRAFLIVASLGGLALVALVHMYFARPAPIEYPPSRPSLAILGMAVLAATSALAILMVALRTPIHIRHVIGALGIALVAAASVANLGLLLAQRSADYSVRYYYGQTGTERAIADVQALTDPDDAIIAAKDIGLEAGRPFYEDAGLFGDPAGLASLIDSGDVDLIVTRCTWDYSDVVWPEAFATIREHAIPVIADRGSDYVLWRPRVGGQDEVGIPNDALCLD